jgi:thiol-disulfide isomerase/thioredoxin
MMLRMAALLALAFLMPAQSGSLTAVSFSQWQQHLSAYRGEIVVVDFWATWCSPCLQRFPHIVQLHERYGGKGVRFVSMALEDRSDPGAIERARTFLKKQNAAFDSYRLDEEIPDAFEKLDLLGIPAVLIYDRAGKLRHKLTGDNPNRQYQNEDVDRALDELLAR